MNQISPQASPNNIDLGQIPLIDVAPYLAGKPGANVCAGESFILDAQSNYFWAPKKFVAAIGVRDLIVVETEDALLVCSRERSQDVGKIVKWLDEQRRRALL